MNIEKLENNIEALRDDDGEILALKNLVGTSYFRKDKIKKIKEFSKGGELIRFSFTEFIVICCSVL